MNQRQRDERRRLEDAYAEGRRDAAEELRPFAGMEFVPFPQTVPDHAAVVEYASNLRVFLRNQEHRHPQDVHNVTRARADLELTVGARTKVLDQRKASRVDRAAPVRAAQALMDPFTSEVRDVPRAEAALEAAWQTEALTQARIAAVSAELAAAEDWLLEAAGHLAAHVETVRRHRLPPGPPTWAWVFRSTGEFVSGNRDRLRSGVQLDGTAYAHSWNRAVDQQGHHSDRTWRVVFSDVTSELFASQTWATRATRPDSNIEDRMHDGRQVWLLDCGLPAEEIKAVLSDHAERAGEPNSLMDLIRDLDARRR